MVNNIYSISLNRTHQSIFNWIINHVKTKDLNQRALRPFKTGFDLEKSIKFLDYKPTSFNKSLDLMFNEN